MDLCLNKGPAQQLRKGNYVGCFQTVFTNVNLNSDIFLKILSFSKSRKYDS